MTALSSVFIHGSLSFEYRRVAFSIVVVDQFIHHQSLLIRVSGSDRVFGEVLTNIEETENVSFDESDHTS